MRQVWISQAGPPSVLQVREAPDPTPGPDDVLVDVAFAGINFADVMARIGVYQDAPPLPCVVGYEVSGRVRALGERIADLAVGDEVACITRFGGYSSVVVAPRAQVMKLPPRTSLDAGAAIPVAYLTAWIMLIEVANVQRDELVLVHSAGGGVGQAALQVARMRGARVIAVASAGKHARLRSEGVVATVEPDRAAIERAVRAHGGERGVDVVLDPNGGASFRDGYGWLAPLGRLVMFGASTIAPGERRSLIAIARGLLTMPRFGAIELMNDNRVVAGVNLGHLWGEPAKIRRMLDDIVGHVASGDFSPVVDRVFSFEEAGEAHAYIQARRNFGKVLLRP